MKAVIVYISKFTHILTLSSIKKVLKITNDIFTGKHMLAILI